MANKVITDNNKEFISAVWDSNKGSLDIVQIYKHASEFDLVKIILTASETKSLGDFIGEVIKY